MPQDHWQRARLIPTSGIKSQEEAERRATSALLAVMGSVREFGHAVVKPIGAPAGAISTFIEVPFKAGERTIYPDGLIETSRGSKTWTALLEVKTGSAELHREQVESYLDIARDEGFDVVLTISNEMAPAPGVHPIDVDKRKLRKVSLHHLSWAEVLTLAVQQRVHRGVEDPDQAWILGELIRYLEHPKSGALDFSDMGQPWVTIREAVAAQTLRANDKGLPEVISRWEQLLRFSALRLGRELGADVQVALSRKEVAEPALRFAAQTRSLVESGVLTGTLRVPDAVAPIDIAADLRAGRVTVSVDVDAPRDGRAATRVNWLVRQLKDAPDGLRVDAFSMGARSSTSELLRSAHEDPAALISDPKRDIRLFRVAAASPLGTKRAVGRGSFIDSVLTSIDGFYGSVVQQLRPWSARAPQLPKDAKTAVQEAGLDVSAPRRELAEPADAGLVEPPPSSPTPAQIVDGVASASDAEAVTPVASAGVEPELVSWSDAQDKLETERDEATSSED
jgi:hypothetical protein